MMWPTFARHACDMHAHVRSVFPCNQSSRQECNVESVGLRYKTKPHQRQMQYTVCSSVIVNKGGNTSTIMKHLLT